MGRVRSLLLAAFVLGLGTSITLAQVSLGGLAALWLWGLRDPRARARVPTVMLWPVLFFLGASALSAWVSPSGSLAASRDGLLAAGLFVTADALDDAAAGDRFLWGLSLVLAVAAAVGLAQVLACPDPVPTEGLGRWFFRRCHRAHGFFSIYMTFAGVLLLALLATLPRILPGPGFRPLALIPWLISLVGLAATYTRSAWLGLVAGALLSLALVRRGRVMLIVGLVLVAAIALLGPETLRERARSMVDPQDPTVVERFHMWESGLAMWATRPWLGVGPGGVKELFPQFALPGATKKRGGHLHNAPLQILVERGIVGLAAWLWLWIAFYASAARALRALPEARWRERALAVGSLAAVTGFLVAGLTEYNFGDSEVVMVAWALMALPFALTRPPGPRLAGEPSMNPHADRR